MEIPFIHLPLDESGLAPSHLKEESYPITEEGYGLLYPSWGPFFTDSVVVLDDGGRELKRDLDWEPFLPYQQASVELGQSVHRGIVVKNPNLATVTFKRQTVGGQYANSNIAFDDIIREYRNHRRTITWDEIIKPGRFTPTDHPHHVDDLNGTQDMTAAILEVVEVLRWYLTGRVIEIDNVNGLVDTLDTLREDIGTNQQSTEQLNVNLKALDEVVKALVTTVNQHNEYSQQTRQQLNATKQALTSLTERVTSIEGALEQASEHRSNIDESIVTINQQLSLLADNSNTFGYRQVSVTGNTPITRLHRTSLYDKAESVSTTHEFSHADFQVGDTVTYSTPLYGNYQTVFSIPSGNFVLPDGTQSNTLPLSGNGGVTWRYLGNRRFLVVEIR